MLTQFKCFLAGVKLRVWLGFYHIPIRYIKKLVFAILLIFCSEYPSFVLVVTITTTLITLLLTVVLRPYRLSFEQTLYCIFDCLFTLIFLVICIMRL